MPERATTPNVFCAGVLRAPGDGARRTELYIVASALEGPWFVHGYDGNEQAFPERAIPQGPLESVARARYVARAIAAALMRRGYVFTGGPPVWRLYAVAHRADDLRPRGL